MQNDKAVQKKSYFKLYTRTRIKARNFLSKVAYNSVNDHDIFDRNFCFHTYVLVTKYLNSFSLERKINNQSKHEAVYMLWKDCMSYEFYKFICKQENVRYIKGKNMLLKKIDDIVWKFICEDKTNYEKLCENLRKNKNILQYSMVYPDVYCNSEQCRFN